MMANHMKETLYWYETHSGLHPSDFCFYINFNYVGMSREAEPKEIDKFRLVYLGRMSREKFGRKELGGTKVKTVTEKIEQWAIDRNLNTADPEKQMLKLGEEFGELCQGMAKGNREQVVDSIGDMYVVMTILSMQLGLDIEDCIEGAYDEIKNRKGKMVNGVFVKEADLEGIA